MAINLLRQYKTEEEYNKDKYSLEYGTVCLIDENLETKFKQKRLIFFSIIDATDDTIQFNCICEECMTFQEFADSEYNNVEYDCGVYISKFNGTSIMVHCDIISSQICESKSYETVLSNDTIIENNKIYYLCYDTSIFQ